MISWIECRTRHPFIAAILDSPVEAARAYAAMPLNVQAVSSIRSRDDLAWPCYLVEDDQGFWFCTPDEAVARVAMNLEAGKLDDEDRVITVYRIVDAFEPEASGRDEMGSISHSHPGATAAALVASRGLGLLWGRLDPLDD